MADFDNLFDAAITRADETIRGVMGTVAHVTSGVLDGRDVSGVFEDPENIGYAGGGVRIEGTSPSLFVKSADVRGLKRYDTLMIHAAAYWVDRVAPDDCGSRYVWLGTGTPPAGNRRR